MSRAVQRRVRLEGAARQQAVAVRKSGSPIPPPPTLSPVTVVGALGDSANVVTATAASLNFAIGRLAADETTEARKILVPFAELRLGGSPVSREPRELDAEADDPPTLYATSVPLDNFAFVLFDLSRDLNRMCGEVAALGSGDLTVDPNRMAVTRYFVAHLERQARSCRLKLDKAFGRPAPEQEGEE